MLLLNAPNNATDALLSLNSCPVPAGAGGQQRDEGADPHTHQALLALQPAEFRHTGGCPCRALARMGFRCECCECRCHDATRRCYGCCAAVLHSAHDAISTKFIRRMHLNLFPTFPFRSSCWACCPLSCSSSTARSWPRGWVRPKFNLKGGEQQPGVMWGYRMGSAP